MLNVLYADEQILNCLERRVHRVAMATSGEHSIMMEKSAQAGGGGGAHPPPFTISTMIPSRTYKLVVYAPSHIGTLVF